MTLTVDRLAVRRGRTAVLHDISLTVGSGEFVCLLGSNGAGKTTLLDCVAGLVRPRSGTLDWNGTDLATLPTHRLVAAGISYAMAGRRMFTGLSVADNVLIGARDTPRRALAARLDAAWTLFPALYERRTARAGGLSGGQQQMLVIAQALACRPKLLLLDEPSAGLAPLLAQEVFAALRTLRELDELSLLVVEQNTEGALGLCDRAYVIDAGTVALRGTCAEVAADDAVSRIYLGGMADVRRRRA